MKTITSRAINSALRAAGLGVEIVNNRDMPDICMQHLLAVMLLDIPPYLLWPEYLEFQFPEEEEVTT